MKTRRPPVAASGRFVLGLVVVAMGAGAGALALKTRGEVRAAGLVGVGGFFVGVWALLAVMSRRALRRAAAREALVAAYPGQPWEWDPAWHGRCIRSGGRTGAWFMAGLALACGGLSAPGVWLLPGELHRGNYPALLILLFWAIGAALALGAAKVWWQWRRHGALTFVPEPWPGSWGGWVGGVVHLERGVRLGGDVTLQLCNVQETVARQHRNRQVSERTLWQDELVLAQERLAPGPLLHHVPVRWHVPRGCGRPSNQAAAAPAVAWRLAIRIPRAGGGAVTGQFELPVFDLGETVPAAAASAGVPSATRVKTEADLAAEAGVIEAWTAEARVWTFFSPAARRAARLQLVLGLVILAVGVALPPVAMGMVVAFALVPLGLGLGLCWHRSELRRTGPRLTLSRSTWRGRRVRTIEVADVADLHLTQSMESNRRLFFRLTLVGTPGVDPETPHPHEHFRARKARYQWRRAVRRGDAAAVHAAAQVMRATPRFEVEVASCLKGPRAAAVVRERLLLALLD